MSAPTPDPVQDIVELLLRRTAGNAIKQGVVSKPGVIILSRDDAEKVLYTVLPHLRAGADPVYTPSNLRFGISPDGKVAYIVTEMDTGRLSAGTLEPSHAVELGSAIIQLAALASAGIKPSPAPLDAPGADNDPEPPLPFPPTVQ